MVPMDRHSGKTAEISEARKSFVEAAKRKPVLSDFLLIVRYLAPPTDEHFVRVLDAVRAVLEVLEPNAEARFQLELYFGFVTENSAHASQVGRGEV